MRPTTARNCREERQMIDYSNGRYTVKDMNGRIVSLIDHDEFVRDGGKLRFRIDGDESLRAGWCQQFEWLHPA